jgi:hypothetical protein
MSENAGGGKAFSVNAAIALAREPSVDSGDEEPARMGSSNRQKRRCLLDLVLVAVSSQLVQ